MDENHISLLEGVVKHIEYIHYFVSVLSILLLPFHVEYNQYSIDLIKEVTCLLDYDDLEENDLQ